MCIYLFTCDVNFDSLVACHFFFTESYTLSPLYIMLRCEGTLCLCKYILFLKPYILTSAPVGTFCLNQLLL